jgi:hypothetical protein
MTKSISTNAKPLVLIAGVMLALVGSLASVNDASATKYESSQASSGENECGNGISPESIFCQNLAAQLEGSGNAVNIIQVQPTAGEENGMQLLP